MRKIKTWLGSVSKDSSERVLESKVASQFVAVFECV